MFNVLCSACFSMEWNIPNVDLFSKLISNTCNILHKHTYLHCDVKHTEEVKTVWLLMDGLMTDEVFFFLFCFHCLIYPQVKLLTDTSPLFHPLVPHTQTQTRTRTQHKPLRFYRFFWTHHSLICAVRGGGRRWQLTGLKHSACGSGRLLLCRCRVISSITSIDPLSSSFPLPARLGGRMRIMEFVAHL